MELNVIGTLNVLEAAANAGVRKLCFSSLPLFTVIIPSYQSVNMRPEPRSPYAVTKLDGEFYCQQFMDAGRLETVVLRFFNVFGPRQDPASPYAAAVPNFFNKRWPGSH